MQNVADASSFEETEKGIKINLAEESGKGKNSQELQVAIHAILSKNASRMDSELVKGS